MAQTADTHTSQASVAPRPLDEVAQMVYKLDLSDILNSGPRQTTISDILANPFALDIEELPESLRPFAQRAARFRSLQQAEETARLSQRDLSQNFDALLSADPSAEDFDVTLNTLAGAERKQAIKQHRWGMSPRTLAEGKPSEIMQRAAQTRLEEIARNSGLEGPVSSAYIDILAINIFDGLMIHQSDGVILWNTVAGQTSPKGMEDALTNAITKPVMNWALEQTAQGVPQLRRRSKEARTN